ncbi:hypothetical protein ACC691_38845, partial [Rhizobium johnstonii]|uniref:hypothetical protein n=1 Tax=Rhizobium johnstonii TaxID=3019933 RepID=UPI003F987A10
EGIRILHSSGMNVMFGFRTLDPDPVRSAALVDGVRIHPFSDRENPAPTRVVSPDGRRWTGDQPRGTLLEDAREPRIRCEWFALLDSQLPEH